MNMRKKFFKGTCSNCGEKKKRVMQYKSNQICGRCIFKVHVFSHMEKLLALKLMRRWA